MMSLTENILKILFVTIVLLFTVAQRSETSSNKLKKQEFSGMIKIDTKKKKLSS